MESGRAPRGMQGSTVGLDYAEEVSSRDVGNLINWNFWECTVKS